MFRLRSAMMVIALVPAVAFAQGKKHGMGSDTKSADWDGMQSGVGSGMKLSNKDVEDMSPVKALIDKQKQLKLSDDVAKQLKDIDAKDKDKNKDLFKSLDSLRGITKPSGVTASETDGVRAQLAMSLAGNVVKQIRDNYAASLQTALPLLDDTQKATANDLVQKQQKDADETLHKKLGGRGPGGPPGADGGPSGGGRGGRGN